MLGLIEAVWDIMCAFDADALLKIKQEATCMHQEASI